MNHLTRNDYASALRLLARLEAESTSLESFARASVEAVGHFVASEITTLSVCDLATGHRQVVGVPGHALAAADIESFDRYFRTPPYADDYRRVRLEHAMAVPLYLDGRTLVSIVLNRRSFDFSERDRERLELLRPHLGFLYRHACAGAAALPDGPAALALAPVRPDPVPAGLTAREGEVMHWLSGGKTDAEIAALLSISPRTVHKHLEHIYVKLGVETRTAAVMRVRAMAGAAALNG